jgi:hypothetical protein
LCIHLLEGVLECRHGGWGFHNRLGPGSIGP